MSFTHKSLSLCFVLVSSLFIASSSTADQKAIYQNQRGSTLTLQWQGDEKQTGTLTGTFITVVGNWPADMNKPMPLTGFFNGNAVAFTVNFPNCKQIVSITGNVIKDGDEIPTLALGIAQNEYPTGKNWNSNIIVADVYKKVK